MVYATRFKTYCENTQIYQGGVRQTHTGYSWSKVQNNQWLNYKLHMNKGKEPPNWLNSKWKNTRKEQSKNNYKTGRVWYNKIQFTLQIASNTEAPKTGIVDIFEYIKKFMRTNKNLPCLLSSYKQGLSNQLKMTNQKIYILKRSYLSQLYLDF